TRDHEMKSNGRQIEDIRRRPILTSKNEVNSTTHQAKSPTVSTSCTISLQPLLESPMVSDSSKKMNGEEWNLYRAIFSRLRACLCSSDHDWTITSVQVDRCSMIMFPLAFLVFNIIYWSIYFIKMDRPM
uniref:Neurotransmitter-gated ion-channel transmembrane domain-containing protein n=1 Tax=Parascaris univalens TaxID=6257 RepID=A0A915BLI1_PARUN